MHFLRLFLAFIQNYVYYHFIFPKIDERGVGIRAGRLETFSKINKRGGDDYSVLQSRCFESFSLHSLKFLILPRTAVMNGLGYQAKVPLNSQ